MIRLAFSVKTWRSCCLISDPEVLIADMSKAERGWLRTHPYFGDPSSRCYGRIENAEDAAIVFARLTG